MEEKFWFNPIYDECHNISEVVRSLKGLSDAFYRVGNINAGRELTEMITYLSESEKMIREQVGLHVGEDFRESEQATKNMVLAALTVATKIKTGDRR